MSRRRLAGAVITMGAAAALAAATQAGAGSRTVPRHYAFSFTVAAKPEDIPGWIPSKVTGSGSGTFSIVHRQIDRDGTVFWDLTGPHGTMSLSIDGKVIVRATVVGGHYGTEKAAGATLRSVLFKLHITSTTRFRCKAPNATLGLDDFPPVKGTTDGMTFDACTTHLQWNGVPPKLTVHVAPA
jgi:hypothetical protein